MAPEIINKTNYAFGIDWFAYGCMIYKLYTGMSPFRLKKDKQENVIEKTLTHVFIEKNKLILLDSIL